MKNGNSSDKEKVKLKSFRDWTWEDLEKTIGLHRATEVPPTLANWLASEQPVSEKERTQLHELAADLLENAENWNEEDLKMNFIALLMKLVHMKNKQYRIFYDQSLKADVGETRLSGKVDMVVASGKLTPQEPYFFIHEYKQEDNPHGNPLGQLLSAMVAAQELNRRERPIFGCYIKGRNWFFVTLEGLEYALSRQFDASDEEKIELIFKMLREVRAYIDQSFKN